MPKKHLYFEIPDNQEVIIKSSPINSSGDIYHILAFLAILNKEKSALPKIKLCWDKDSSTSGNPSTKVQATRMKSFADAINLGDNIEIIKVEYKSAQPVAREKASRDKFPDTYLIDQRMTTAAISRYFEEHGFEATSTAIRTVFQARNSSISLVDKDQLTNYKTEYSEKIGKLNNTKPVVVFHYRYSSTANKDQSDVNFFTKVANFIKERDYQVILVTADDRDEKDLSDKENELKKAVDVFFAPFIRSKLVKTNDQVSTPDCAKLYHLDLLTHILECSLKGSINLKGVLGTTSGTLDVAAFIGHNVYNLHNFGSTFDYQDARILAQSIFMRVYSKGDILQIAFYNEQSYRYVVVGNGRLNFLAKDQSEFERTFKQIVFQPLYATYFKSASNGDQADVAEKTERDYFTAQSFALELYKNVIVQDYKSLQTKAIAKEIPILSGYEGKRIEGDGNCMFNAVIVALDPQNRNIMDRIFDSNADKQDQIYILLSKIEHYYRNKNPDPNDKLVLVQNIKAILQLYHNIDLQTLTDEDIMKKSLELIQIMALRQKIVKYVEDKANSDPGYKASLVENAKVTLQLFHKIKTEELTDENVIIQYLEFIKRDKEWGDHVALHALASILKVQIHVHSSHPSVEIGDASASHIHLYLHGEVHYDAYVITEEQYYTDCLMKMEDMFISGPANSLGVPMKLKDLLINADLFKIEAIDDLPQAKEGYKYLIIDSDNYIREYKVDREDIEIFYQDIQLGTASCGDNALLLARKAKELGFESYIYVANGHAVALIRYDEKLDHEQILQMIDVAELQEDAGLWKKYIEVMIGNVLYLGNSKEAILQEFGKILKDLDFTENEALKTRIETLLIKIDSTNISNLNTLKPVLQGLLEQLNESQELKTVLDTNNLDTLYNNLVAYITEFADSATEATKGLLQSLLFSVEEEFLNPLQGGTNYFPPYYPPGKPDDEPDYRGESGGSGGQNPNDNYAMMTSGNNTSTNYSMAE